MQLCGYNHFHESNRFLFHFFSGTTYRMRPFKETLRSMNLNARVPAAAALIASFGLLLGCAQLKARDQINKGVGAFKNAQYEEAIGHFQEAIRLDPKLPQAKLYLGTAYSYMVIPNATDDANLKTANNAIAIFKDYLAEHPGDKNSLQQLASIYRNIKQPAQSKAYELQVIQVDPKDAEAHYSIGSADFAEAYNNAVKILGQDGLKDDGTGNVKMSKGACASIKAANTAIVNDGISHLDEAVKLRTDYDDALGYLNLIYRRKADVDCGDPAAVKQDVAMADDYTKQAMGARANNEKKKEEKATQGTVTAQ
jgi:tetratricopeptide (TPR) repeat protein